MCSSFALCSPVHPLATALPNASAVKAEVKTPSKRCAENPIRSPLLAVFAVKVGKKPQSKMSNLFLIRLSRSTVLAPFPRRLCREMSKSRRRPVVALDAVLGNGFSAGGREGNYIRRKSHCFAHSNHEQKSCTKAKLIHASTQFFES